MAPYDGNGTYLRVHDWTQDRANGVTINADRHDLEDDGFATGLSNAITKDGQTTVTADIPMSGHKFTGLAEGAVPGDSVNYEQLAAAIDAATGSIGIQVHSADFSVGVADQGVMHVFDCDTAAGPLVATLPTAAAFGTGKRVRFRLKALATEVLGGFSERRHGYVNCATGDRFDDDGPRWALTGMTAPEGTYLYDIVGVGGDNNPIQRQIDEGDWVEIAGVVGSAGITADANGLWQAGERINATGVQIGGGGGELWVHVDRPVPPITGTVAVSGTAVTGTGTLFTTQLQVGEQIRFAANHGLATIAAIADNTHLTLVAAPELLLAGRVLTNGTVNVDGTGDNLFTEQLSVGDDIRVVDTGETQTIVAVLDDSNLTVDTIMTADASSAAYGVFHTFTGSQVTGTWTSGGTATKVCRQIPLRVQHSYVELESDGVSRWYRTGGFLDTWPEMDLMFGVNRFYEAGASSSNGYRVGWGAGGNFAAPVDNFYNTKTLRPTYRSLFLTEVHDGVEVALRRTITDLAAGSHYPNGTIYLPTPVATSAIIHVTFHNSNSFQGRSAVFVVRAAEDIVVGGGNQGGEIELHTTAVATSGPVARWWLSSEGKVSSGSKSPTTGQSSIVGSDDEPQLFAHAKHATYTSSVIRARATRAGSSAYKLIDAQSNNGSDTEFWVDGVGTVASDGGTAMTTPADYAEMVREWWDGNAGGEDRAGMSVVLVRRDNLDTVILPDDDTHDDSFIRTVRSLPAPPPREAVIGVVSANPAILGSSGATRWVRKYVTDAFGRILMEDCETVSWRVVTGKVEGRMDDPTELSDEQTVVYYTDQPLPEGVTIPAEPEQTLNETILEARKRWGSTYRWTSGPVYATAQRRKVNPEYDPAIPNVPRQDRLEWDAVGLLGKLGVLTGELRGVGWIKTGDIEAGVEEWLVR